MNELINLGNGQFVKVTMLKGEKGTNIATITKTGTSGLVDTYTVTLTDGHTTTFEVTNGSSIASIEKTSTVGTVDTYTITLTNGETSTFTVTNATGIIDPNFSETSTNAIQTSTVTNVISGVENGATASRTYNVGEYILRNNLMYKVIALTASGEAWNVGLNLEATGIGAELTQLNNDLNDKVERMTNVSGYQTVDVLGYNPTTKKLGLKVNGADTVIPFNSGLEEVTLWTNSSSTSSFASQNITVDGGTSTYKGFCIYWKYRENDSSHLSASKTYNLTSGAQACGCVNSGVSNAFTFRECVISSISSASTTFKIGNGFAIASGSVGSNNVYCIPTKITGIK